MRRRSTPGTRGQCALKSACLVEQLEGRAFQSVSTDVHGYLTDLSSYSYFAQADLGDFGRDLPQRVAHRSRPKLASRTGGAGRTPVLRDRNWSGCVL